MKVADPLGLLGPEEGGSDAVPQAAGVGLQEDRGASRELQGACSQGILREEVHCWGPE